MNVILIISDSFRWDNLCGERGAEVHTPSLDRLVQEATIFENAYLASFPTVPHRHDVMTGRHTCTYAGWQPLPADAVTIQDVLGAAGVMTICVCDTPHPVGRGFNYVRGFEGFHWIRGQEADHYRTSPQEVTFPCAPEKLREPEYIIRHYVS